MKPLFRAPLSALLLAASGLWPATQCAAADAPRARPAGQAASAAQPGTADCDRLWRNYRRSQACFERFRTASGGLRPSAVARCGEPLPDPSAQCGPQTLPN